MTKHLNFNAASNNQNREAALAYASFPQTSIANTINVAEGRNSHFDDEEFQLDV